MLATYISYAVQDFKFMYKYNPTRFSRSLFSLSLSLSVFKLKRKKRKEKKRKKKRVAHSKSSPTLLLSPFNSTLSKRAIKIPTNPIAPAPKTVGRTFQNSGSLSSFRNHTPPPSATRFGRSESPTDPTRNGEEHAGEEAPHVHRGSTHLVRDSPY